MTSNALLCLALAVGLGGAPEAAAADPQARTPVAASAAPTALGEDALAETRGGLATPLGVDIGFGATVRTYVDGTLALETRLTWSAEGALAERTFESDAVRHLAPTGADRAVGAQVLVAPGTSVVHDLAQNRIASVVLNTASDRTIRQETDVSLHLPQLPDIQQRIAAERLSQSLQALSPSASGIGR